MNTVSLIIALYESVLFLNNLERKLLEQNPPHTYWKTVSLNHTTITLTLHTKSPGLKKNMSDLYLKIMFDIHAENITLSGLYSEDDTVVTELRNYITTHAPKHFDTATSDTVLLGDEVLEYLRMADEIAKQAHQCAAGDHYHAGYFSEMLIEDTQIILKQINHWNARSINHKKDYYLRDLEFYIPLTPDAIEPSFQDEYIGRMLIHYTDHSTPNNKSCGNKIAAQIKTEKSIFESNK